MGKQFGFTERQAIDILDMQLRQLTRLSRIDLETEQKDVQTHIKELKAILNDDKKLRAVISKSSQRFVKRSPPIGSAKLQPTSAK